MKSLIKKILPSFLLSWYHKALAIFANFYFGHPSDKLIVIGVTGTNGKSTVVNLIGRILEEAGFKTGLTSTINFKVAEKEWLNDKKMTMLGRFTLQKLVKKMLNQGGEYAIIETTSEGIKQFRHLGINYDLVVFTNLTPEHIESHGSFKKYKQAKGELFRKLKNQKTKKLERRVIKKISIVNLDDEHSDYFLQFAADKKYGFGIKYNPERMKSKVDKFIKANNIKLESTCSYFMIYNLKFRINLLGKFNIYNCLAAIAVALSQGINLETCREALEKVKSIPGRLEFINEGQPFTVIVDYAHEPVALTKVYETLHKAHVINHKSKVIHVLGSAGGGRDKAKRPILGRIAAENANIVIVTNEDPYDENPKEIIDQVGKGAQEKCQMLALSEVEGSNVKCQMFKILDRREAVRKALSLAQKNDLVLITGKGCEQAICLAHGKKIPWDDREVVREELKSMKDKV